MPTIWEKWGRSCRACFTGALGSGIVGGQGLGSRGSYRNRLDQDIGFAWHVPHERPYSPFPTALKKDMSVVIHDDPCIDGSTRLGDLLTETFQEPGSIPLVLEDGRFIEPSHHDVMQGAGDI
jgi:hypothetical protein